MVATSAGLRKSSDMENNLENLTIWRFRQDGRSQCGDHSGSISAGLAPGRNKALRQHSPHGETDVRGLRFREISQRWAQPG